MPAPFPRPRFSPLLAVLLGAGAGAHAGTVIVTPEVTGETPALFGANLGHFMPGSNAADWWRHSGLKSARVFLPVGLAEPTDDLPPFGDGVGTAAQFAARRAAMRADPLATSASASTEPHLRPPFVNWSQVRARFAGAVTTGTNRWILDPTFTELRSQGVELTIQLTASLNAFAVVDENDWAGLWELWQHYYFTAHHLALVHGVRRYSTFNEPDHANANGITVAQWLLRLRFASDAIQSAIADVNRDHGTALVPVIYAPTTAGASVTDVEGWGRPALEAMHLRPDGVVDPEWNAFHVYSYQVYGSNPTSFANHVANIRPVVASVLGAEAGTTFPLAATEYGVRDNTQFGLTTATLDSPEFFVAHGAISLAIARAGVDEMFVYKFSQTASSSAAYGLIKSGLHHVDNPSGRGLLDLNQIGGLTRGGEITRLLARAFGVSRPVLAAQKPAGLENVDVLATLDPATGVVHVLALNRGTVAVPLSLDVSALGVRQDNRVPIFEVSSEFAGGVRQLGRVQQGLITPSASLPAQSLWVFRIARAPHLVRWPEAIPTRTYQAVADAALRDGAHRATPDGAGTSLLVRNGVAAAEDRRVALIRFDLSAEDFRDLDVALLSLQVASTGEGPAQAHVYGLADPAFDETAITWAGFTRLRQNAAAGPRIEHNVVQGHGRDVFIQGQLVASSATLGEKQLDVTEFVRAQGPGRIAFLIVQEARWNTSIQDRTPAELIEDDGDIQPAGLVVAAREDSSARAPRLRIIRRERPRNVWRFETFGVTTDVGPAADLADPDGDGLPNLLEYALGGDPLRPELPGLTPSASVRADGALAFSFPRLRDDLAYHVESSADLQVWTTVATDPGTVGETVTVFAPSPLSGAGRHFLRLRVSPR